jgi:hypothetical protein
VFGRVWCLVFSVSGASPLAFVGNLAKIITDAKGEAGMFK